MPVTTMAVTASFYDVDGTVAVGTVSFTPNRAARKVNDVKICSIATQVVTLDVNGALAVTLVRFSEGYSVTEQIVGADPRTYIITDGATANLKDF